VLTKPNNDYYHDAEKVNWYLKKELPKYLGSSDPFFLYVHYFDPHHPYYQHPHPWIDFNLYARFALDRLTGAYDQEITFVDAAIGELVGLLEAAGKLDNTIIVLTSDHGEEFDDHGGWGHGKTLYNELLRVPLIMSAPGRFPADSKVTLPARGIDIAPTVLDSLSIQAPAEFEGRSLLAAMHGTEQGSAPVVSQLLAPRVRQDSIVAGRYKLIRTAPVAAGSGEATIELYDLEADAGETNDLHAALPNVTGDLNAALEGYLARFSQSQLAPDQDKLSRQQIDQLKALGYLN
jgi:arylsulfatase A-like enzyme